MNNLKRIYFLLPVFIQNMVISIVGYRLKKTRMNNEFFSFLKFYNTTPKEELIKREQIRLKEFLEFSQKSFFWKEKFEKYNVDITSENIEEELRKLPVLTKEEVKDNINNILIKDRNLIKVHTSGTTGGGLIFYESKKSQSERWAVWWRYRMYHGIKIDTWFGWFGGMSIINIKQKKPPFYRVNYPERRVMFSAHHLNEDTVSHYSNAIIKRRLIWLHGYPSQLSYFASLCLDKNINFEFVTNITLGAENFLKNQKNIMQRVFPNAKITEHYGLAESVANISENKERDLVLDRYFSYSEFIPTENKNKYRIVGTNLSNPNFPLIRYNTNDIATVIDNKIISIDGRKEDFVLLKDGTKYGRLDHIFKDLIHIKEAQIRQISTDKIVFHIVKGKHFDKEKELDKLIYEINALFKDKIEFEIVFKNFIERTESGKLRFVISEIN